MLSYCDAQSILWIFYSWFDIFQEHVQSSQLSIADGEGSKILVTGLAAVPHACHQSAVQSRVGNMAGVLFEDIFNVKDIDPEGKKFDRGKFTINLASRYDPTSICYSDTYVVSPSKSPRTPFTSELTLPVNENTRGTSVLDVLAKLMFLSFSRCFGNTIVVTFINTMAHIRVTVIVLVGTNRAYWRVIRTWTVKQVVQLLTVCLHQLASKNLPFDLFNCIYWMWKPLWRVILILF